MITKDKIDLPILEITPENYLVPKGEEHLYHVKMEVKEFDRKTGDRLSHPFIQKFHPVDLENGMMSLLKQQGYTMDILHDPHTWLKKKAEASAEAKAKAKAAEKEALRAEILREMAEEEAKKKAEAEKKAKAEADAKKKAEAKAEKENKKEEPKGDIPGLD